MSEEDFDAILPGQLIRLSDGDDVDIPLWSREVGLLFVEREELVAFGFSAELAADIEEWGERSPSTTVRGALGRRRPWATQAERDTRGIELVRRMTEELGGTYRFVYQPDRHRSSESWDGAAEVSDALDPALTADEIRKHQLGDGDGIEP